MTEEILLISDLDDTFLGDRDALRRFGGFFPSVCEQLAIVYASGRFFESIKRDVQATPLPQPVAVIGGVGSEIRSFPDGGLNQKWIERISQNWSAQQVREILADEAELELQPEKFQSDFKVSYYLRGASSEKLDRLRAKLFDAGINASLIYSSACDLDFLPEGVNKGTAAAFMSRELGFDRDHVIVAGNSGNDSKLFEHDFYGIIVSNAHQELERYADRRRVYLSPQARADGVRDGLQHWIGKLTERDLPHSSQSPDQPQPQSQSQSQSQLSEEGYQRTLDLLHACSTKHGFLATPTEKDNYRRIWGRDSAIMGLAALLSEESDLVESCRRSLETLARYQGPHGEIPSNVDPTTERVSYGGTAGRVDADLWFVICCGEYWRYTGDDAFLDRMIEPLEKVRFLLGTWEFNTRGLLYIPPTGDWADEYLQSGYVLVDQLLYLQAQQEFCEMHRHLHETAHHDLDDRVARLKHLIQANYWFIDGDQTPDDVYHEVLYEKGRKAAPHLRGSYWMPFFSPVGYGYRFDAMANALVMLLGVAEESQCKVVDDYIAENIVHDQVMLLPAFDPVITPKDEAWEDLQMTFSHTFKNAPYEYHNGGLWPLVTGFYAASLAKRDQPELAQQYCEGIHAANRMAKDGRQWTFPEYVHGQEHSPEGTSPMGWSAAAAVIAEQFLRGKRLFE